MKNFKFLRITAIAALVSSIVISCKKDSTDVSSPNFQINESEKITVPPEVELPANNAGYKRVATFYAEGVQKYKAQIKAGTTSTLEWVFVAPKAELFDINNNKVGTHSAGPTWQLYGGADSIYGQAFVPAKTAPASDALSVDWLLLMPKTGKTPTGIFTPVSFIQRLVTKGGKAPVTTPVNISDTVDVNYTAIYRFSTPN